MKIYTSPSFIKVTINGEHKYIHVQDGLFYLEDVCKFVNRDMNIIRNECDTQKSDSKGRILINNTDFEYIFYKYASSDILKMFQVRVFNNPTLMDVHKEYEQLKLNLEGCKAVVAALEQMYNTISTDSSSTITKYPSSCAMFVEVLDIFRIKISTFTEIMRSMEDSIKLFYEKHDIDNYNTNYEPDYVKPKWYTEIYDDSEYDSPYYGTSDEETDDEKDVHQKLTAIKTYVDKLSLLLK